MPTITVRNLPEAVHQALRVQAALNGRSTEAEVRSILEASVLPAERVLMGAALAELGRRAGLKNADLDAIEQLRDKTPANPPRFE